MVFQDVQALHGTRGVRHGMVQEFLVALEVLDRHTLGACYSGDAVLGTSNVRVELHLGLLQVGHGGT